MKLVTVTVLALAALSLAPAAAAAPPSASGFVGNWTTTDCATSTSGEIHCEVWGDGSAMQLNVGVGDTPRITFKDLFAGSCTNEGSPNTHWVGAGTGYYEDIFLFAPLDKTGCGTFQMNSGVELQFYYDPGSDTLWEDEDGDEWGYVWYRFP